MGDISNVIGGPWAAPLPPEPPEKQLRAAIEQEGLAPPAEVILDGKIHRFDADKSPLGRGKRSKKTGWYVAFGDGVPAGRFGCWKSGVDETWRADIGRQLSHAEEMIRATALERARKEREEAAKLHREVAENSIALIWGDTAPASKEHPYLLRKRVQPHGTRVTGDGRLIVPMHDEFGELRSVQYIDANGGKLYHSFGEAKGKSYLLGSNADGTLYIAEGFATAATVHEVTGKQCLVSFSASNLVAVAQQARARWEERKIVLVADNDKKGIGRFYADQASSLINASVIMPPDIGDVNDYYIAGGDLLGLLEPPTSTWLIPASAMMTEPPPVKWLVRGWLQEGSLMMIHGPSGSGKTFLALDWALSIASGKGDWLGSRTATGRVVYLAGEGHYGLRVRMAAWAQHNNITNIDAFISSHGVDLNKPAGWSHVATHLREIGKPPSLIVVDTLHRFLAGDENSAEDARQMIQACNSLTEHFGCAVLLVHHTGHGNTGRARGSSAWKGALDIEISVASADGSMSVEQKKSKDSPEHEPITLVHNVIQLDGRVDEDGEPVTSLVLSLGERAEPAPDDRKQPDLSVAVRVFERAWWASECEEKCGRPYVTASAVRRLLLADGYSQHAARKATTADGGKTFTLLLNAGVIEPSGAGWVVVDGAQCSRLMLAKSAV